MISHLRYDKKNLWFTLIITKNAHSELEMNDESLRLLMTFDIHHILNKKAFEFNSLCAFGETRNLLVFPPNSVIHAADSGNFLQSKSLLMHWQTQFVS